MTTTSLPLKYFIGAIQVAGGGLLVYALFVRLLQGGLLSLIIVSIPILLFTFLSFYSGISLLKNKKNGITLSLWNFALQLFQFSFSGIYYEYITGPYVGIGYRKLENSSIEFWTDYEYFSGRLFLSFFPESTNSHFLTINLVTVIILALLLYLKGREKEKQ